MPVGTTAAIMLGVGAAGAGFAASKLMTPKSQGMQPIPLPQPPSQAVAQDAGQKIVNQKRASQTQTIFSTPLGLPAQADIAKKTLLGQ